MPTTTRILLIFVACIVCPITPTYYSIQNVNGCFWIHINGTLHCKSKTLAQRLTTPTTYGYLFNFIPVSVDFQHLIQQAILKKRTIYDPNKCKFYSNNYINVVCTQTDKQHINQNSPHISPFYPCNHCFGHQSEIKRHENLLTRLHTDISTLNNTQWYLIQHIQSELFVTTTLIPADPYFPHNPNSYDWVNSLSLVPSSRIRLEQLFTFIHASKNSNTFWIVNAANINGFAYDNSLVVNNTFNEIIMTDLPALKNVSLWKLQSNDESNGFNLNHLNPPQSSNLNDKLLIAIFAVIVAMILIAVAICIYIYKCYLPNIKPSEQT
eukprot:40189_1